MNDLPPSSEPWYDATLGHKGGLKFFGSTAEQRRSQARFILNGNGGERSWDLPNLADSDPDALRPWADGVLRFDDDALQRLCAVDFVDFWRAGVGASDEAIDELAAELHVRPPAELRHYGGEATPSQARVDLFIGADSDHALMHLGELGRAFPVIARMCARRSVAVPPAGPAVRRYSRRPRLLEGYTPDDCERLQLLPESAVRLDTPVEAVLVEARGAPGERVRAITTTCESCEGDEDTRAYFWTRAGDGRLKSVSPRRRCQGEPLSREKPALRFTIRDENQYRVRDPDAPRPKLTVRLGGWPCWMQAYPSVACCWGKPMFYVGTVKTRNMFATAYLFVCECGAVAQTRQFT